MELRSLVVVGANGAGKTTMIKILMNLIEATSGTAEILEADSRRLSPEQLAQIGYVSEDQLLPAKLTISEYLNYLPPFYPTWDKQLEAEGLKQFRLPRNPHRCAQPRHAAENDPSLCVAVQAQAAGPG